MREIRCEVMPAQLSAAAVSGLLAGGDNFDLDEKLGPQQRTPGLSCRTSGSL
jgi:hypothetical protein